MTKPTYNTGPGAAEPARRTETDAVIEAATRAAAANDLAPLTGAADEVDGLLVVDLPHTRAVHVQDLEQYLDTPRAKTGHVAVSSSAALVQYVKQHGDRGTSLWADRDAGRVAAVIDDHVPGDNLTAGWGRHRATLTLRHTPEWMHWTKHDNNLLDQATFAEHLEDGLPAVVEPAAAVVLEACRTLHVQRESTFQSADRPHSGEVRFVYQEEDTAVAGKKGDLELPLEFALDLAPWEGTPAVRLIARLRYRLNNGALALGYRLIRPHEALADAWEQLVAHVADETGLYVYAGTPRS